MPPEPMAKLECQNARTSEIVVSSPSPFVWWVLSKKLVSRRNGWEEAKGSQAETGGYDSGDFGTKSPAKASYWQREFGGKPSGHMFSDPNVMCGLEVGMVSIAGFVWGLTVVIGSLILSDPYSLGQGTSAMKGTNSKTCWRDR